MFRFYWVRLMGRRQTKASGILPLGNITMPREGSGEKEEEGLLRLEGEEIPPVIGM